AKGISDLGDDSGDIVLDAPARVMGLELRQIANPPLVIADASLLDISPVEFPTDRLLGHIDGFKHRAVRVHPAADVIDFTRPWRLDLFPERFDKVARMKVISYLFALVPEDAIGTPLDACAD